MDELVFLKSDVKRLTAEVERLEQRVRDLEARWEQEIWGGVNGELAELRGTVEGMRKGHEEALALILKRLLQ